MDLDVQPYLVYTLTTTLEIGSHRIPGLIAASCSLSGPQLGPVPWRIVLVQKLRILPARRIISL